jgi:hypothetical protein
VVGSGGRGVGTGEGARGRSGDAGTGAAQLREQPGREWVTGGADESLAQADGGDKGRRAVTWTKTERVGGGRGSVGGRVGLRQTENRRGRLCDLDQAPGRAVGYREVHCCCA